MKCFKCLLLMGCCSWLGACSDPAPTPTSQNQANAPAPAASVAPRPAGVIPQGQLDALKKAGQVSDVLKDAEEARRKQMEAQGI